MIGIQERNSDDLLRINQLLWLIIKGKTKMDIVVLIVPAYSQFIQSQNTSGQV